MGREGGVEKEKTEDTGGKNTEARMQRASSDAASERWLVGSKINTTGEYKKHESFHVVERKFTERSRD